MMDFRMVRYNTRDEAEAFAERVDGTMLYVKEFGFFIVRF